MVRAITTSTNLREDQTQRQKTNRNMIPQDWHSHRGLLTAMYHEHIDTANRLNRKSMRRLARTLLERAEKLFKLIADVDAMKSPPDVKPANRTSLRMLGPDSCDSAEIL